MTYLVNNTAGNLIATIADGTSNTSTSLLLVGRKFSGYGEILQENLVKLLENFALSVAPTVPLNGQIWYDTSSAVLKVYDSALLSWKNASGARVSASTPVTAITGDVWWDTTNDQLNIYNGSTWTLIGPSFSKVVGLSGEVVESLTDNLSAVHNVVSYYLSGTRMAIMSHSSFTTAPTVVGFATIVPGLNANSVVSSFRFGGVSSDSDRLGGVLASQIATTAQLAANVSTLSTTLSLAMSSNITLVNANASATNANVVSANVAINSLQSSKAPLANPSFTGVPLAPTATTSTANTQIATTAFVSTAISNLSSTIGTNFASLTSPALIGIPTSTTANVNVSTTQIATTAFVHNILPPGMILQWFGNTANVPYGWALCDGTNVNGHLTPNLVDKFVVAAGPTHPAGTSGGNNTASSNTGTGGAHSHSAGLTQLTVDQLPAHTHSATIASDGAHTHDISKVQALQNTYWWYQQSLVSTTDIVNPPTASNVSTSIAGSHTHAATIASNGGGAAHSHSVSSDAGHTHSISLAILPSYYALCYIMKVV